MRRPSPIVEFAEVTPYEQYVGVRQLQALVRPVTDHPAEPAFLVVTQVMELWFTLLRREWERAQRRAAGRRPRRRGRGDPALGAPPALARRQLAVAAVADPGRVQRLPRAARRGVGLPVLRVPARGVPARAQGGVRRPAAPGAARPCTPTCSARWPAPSLEDDVLAYLARRGLPVPADVLDRDRTTHARAAPGGHRALGRGLPRSAPGQRPVRAGRGAHRRRRGVHDRGGSGT